MANAQEHQANGGLPDGVSAFQIQFFIPIQGMSQAALAGLFGAPMTDLPAEQLPGLPAPGFGLAHLAPPPEFLQAISQLLATLLSAGPPPPGFAGAFGGVPLERKFVPPPPTLTSVWVIPRSPALPSLRSPLSTPSSSPSSSCGPPPTTPARAQRSPAGPASRRAAWTTACEPPWPQEVG